MLYNIVMHPGLVRITDTSEDFRYQKGIGIMNAQIERKPDLGRTLATCDHLSQAKQLMEYPEVGAIVCFDPRVQQIQAGLYEALKSYKDGGGTISAYGIAQGLKQYGKPELQELIDELGREMASVFSRRQLLGKGFDEVEPGGGIPHTHDRAHGYYIATQLDSKGNPRDLSDNQGSVVYSMEGGSTTIHKVSIAALTFINPHMVHHSPWQVWERVSRFRYFITSSPYA